MWGIILSWMSAGCGVVQSSLILNMFEAYYTGFLLDWIRVIGKSIIIDESGLSLSLGKNGTDIQWNEGRRRFVKVLGKGGKIKEPADSVVKFK